MSSTILGRLVTRLGAVLAPVVLFAAFCVPPQASASCSSSSPGDSEPEGRPYIAGTESLDPSVRKYFALTTTNADGSHEPCDCIQPRPWGQGLPPEAVGSLTAAMDAKEAKAFENYAYYGIPPEAVPVEARTIWMRVTWRSFEEQSCLFNILGPSVAAQPGESKHETGLAIDIEDWGPQFFGDDDRLLYAQDWCRTVPSEPWHYEYRPLLEAIGQGSRCK